jgi:hypothetical protein
MGRPPRSVKVSMPDRFRRCSTICRVTASSHQVSVCIGGGGPPGAVYFACGGGDNQCHTRSHMTGCTAECSLRISPTAIWEGGGMQHSKVQAVQN